jgi:hypothetical protein
MMADIPIPQRSTQRKERATGRSVSLLADVAAGWRAKAAASPTLQVIKVVMPIWLVSRLLYVILTYAAVLLTLGSAHEKEPFPPHLLLSMWQRWDVNWYLSVAAGGYVNSSIRSAFFPLYPALTALLTAVIGSGQRLAAAMIIASLGALAACIGLGLLAEREFPVFSSRSEEQFTPQRSDAAAPSAASTASAAVRVMLAYPLALFMFAGYADSVLIACCVFAIYFARCRRWHWAIVFAFAAGLTRPTSVILVLPLFYEYGAAYGLWQMALHLRWRELRRRLRPSLLGTWLLVTAATPLAIGLYAVYLGHFFGDPLLFVHLQATAWHRYLLPPWQVVKLAASTWHHAIAWGFVRARMLVDELPVVVFAVLTFFIARRLPLTYTLLMLGVLFTSVATPVVHGQFPFAAAGRYLLPAIPVYLLLGSWMRRRPWLDQLIVGGGMALQAILIVFFLNGGLLV